MPLRPSFALVEERLPAAPGHPSPVYDVDPSVPALVMGENRKMLRALESPVWVPTFEAGEDEVDALAVRMLLRAAGPEPRGVASFAEAVAAAQKEMRDRDLSLSGFLTGGPEELPAGSILRRMTHPNVPARTILFLAEPEFVGFLVRRGDKVGMLIHNPKGVAGFRILPN